MEKAPRLNGVPISVLGSNRAFKSALEAVSHDSDEGRIDREFPPACLVIPEGIASECYLLFEFSLACARECPDVLFIWRLHPLVTHESLVRKSPKLRNLPPNVVLSTSTLEEDILRCRWALYRGTTAVVQAVVAGLRPIYLRLQKEMTIDPLYELEGWRANVATVTEFADIIQRRVPDATVDPLDVEAAKKYAENFFVPLNPKALCGSVTCDVQQ